MWLPELSFNLISQEIVEINCFIDVPPRGKQARLLQYLSHPGYRPAWRYGCIISQRPRHFLAKWLLLIQGGALEKVSTNISHQRSAPKMAREWRYHPDKVDFIEERTTSTSFIHITIRGPYGGYLWRGFMNIRTKN